MTEIVRQEMTKVLGEIDGSAMLDSLAALWDEHWRINEEAQKSLRRIGKPVVPELLAALQMALQDKNEPLIATLAEILGQIGDLRSVHILLATLNIEDDYGYLGSVAAEALQQIGEPAVPELVAALQNENERVRRIIVHVLGQIGGALVIDALLATIQGKSESVRKEVVEALGNVRGMQAVEALLTTLKDKCIGIREEAVKALGKIKGPRAVEGLLMALKDQDEDIRSEVIKTLGNVGEMQAIEALLAILRDEKEIWSLRRSSAYSLKQIGNQQVIEELQVLLLDEIGRAHV